MYTTIIFDMDGTLLDTSKGIFQTANHTMKILGYDELPESQLRKFVGPPLPACFRIACGLNEEEIPKACEIYRSEYVKGNMHLNTIYPEITDLLESLKNRGFTLGIATLKTEDMAIDILKERQLFPYFSSIRGANRDENLSKADIIELAIKDLQIEEYSSVLMVGDTPHDLDGAQSVGIDFVGVDWGFGFHKGHEFDIQPHVLGMIDQAHQLLDYLS